MHNVGSTGTNFPKIKYGYLCANGCVRFAWYSGKIHSRDLFLHRVYWQSGYKSSLLAVGHSSISMKERQMLKNFFPYFFSLISSSKSGCYYYSPVQFTPFPAYPGLQRHLNDPGLLTQVAFDEQLLAPGVLHSSTSGRRWFGYN